MDNKKKRLRYLDFVRGVAVLLVMYGHLVDVCTYAPTVPDVINEINNINLPIIPPDTHGLWHLSTFLLYSGGVQTAVMGVFLFFLLTGCLIPDSLDRYSNPVAFLVNRFLRIFPTLWVCMIVLCISVYFFQGISFPWIRILATLTMTSKTLMIPVISGVLWTLSIELFFYVLCAIIRKFTLKRVYIVLISTIIMVYLCPSGNYYIDGVVTDLKWISIILCGVTFNLVQREFKAGNRKGVYHMAVIMLLSFICFHVYAHSFGDDTTYPRLSTWIFAFSIFYAAMFFNWCVPELFEKKLFIPLYKLAELCFPIYLIHVAVGIPIMYKLHMGGWPSGALPFVGGGVSVALAWLVNRIVENPSLTLSRYVVNHIMDRRPK